MRRRSPVRLSLPLGLLGRSKAMRGAGTADASSLLVDTTPLSAGRLSTSSMSGSNWA